LFTSTRERTWKKALRYIYSRDYGSFVTAASGKFFSDGCGRSSESRGEEAAAGMASAEYRKRHKALGLCMDCPNPAIPGMTRCASCNYSNLRRNAKYRRQHPGRQRAKKAKEYRERKDAGRCPKCGRILTDYDEGNIQCSVCTLHLGRPKELGRRKVVIYDTA